MSFNILKIDTSIRGHKDSFSSRMGEYAVKTIQKPSAAEILSILTCTKPRYPTLLPSGTKRRTRLWDCAAKPKTKCLIPLI